MKKENENKDLEFELKQAVNNWIDRQFNILHIDVIKIVLESEGDYLEEYIEPAPIDYDDMLNNYSLHKEYKEWCNDNEFSNEELEDNETKASFLEDNYQGYIDEAQESNYPMWNFIFEHKGSTWEALSEAALKAGCGVINQSDYFNDAIFMRSAGHSFLSAYWVKIYLELFDKEGKYKDVDYSRL